MVIARGICLNPQATSMFASEPRQEHGIAAQGACGSKTPPHELAGMPRPLLPSSKDKPSLRMAPPRTRSSVHAGGGGELAGPCPRITATLSFTFWWHEGAPATRHLAHLKFCASTAVALAKCVSAGDSRRACWQWPSVMGGHVGVLQQVEAHRTAWDEDLCITMHTVE